MAVLDSLTTLVEAGAAAPWVLPMMVLIALGDALVPPIPSEGLLVSLAAISVAGDGPDLLLLGVAAAVGAFVGDTLTYLVGRRYGPDRLARITRPGLRRLLERASATLERRGAVVILAARYVPMGRVAVNLTAGATGFPPRRFVGIAALAALSWAVWSVGVGALAGHWLEGNPLLGSLAGIAMALVLGVVVDRGARRFTGWGRIPSPAAPTPAHHPRMPALPASVVDDVTLDALSAPAFTASTRA
jgi:membrane-associated protein